MSKMKANSVYICSCDFQVEPIIGDRSYDDEYDDYDGEGELTIKEEPLDETEEGYDPLTIVKTEDDSDDDIPLVSFCMRLL